MFLTRCKDTSKKNTLYYTTEIVRDIVQSNEEKVKIINTGVKVQQLKINLAIFFHSFFLAIVIGIINTSGGIGKIKLSMKSLII